MVSFSSMEGTSRRWRDPWPRPSMVDPTLRRIAVLFRVLGWIWMLILVWLGLTAPVGHPSSIGRPWVALVALTLATGWTIVTVLVARSETFASLWFISVDLLVALAVGAASAFADTKDVFHGGYPMSWVLVAAAAGGFRWAFPGSMILGIEQYAVRVEIGRSVSGAAFALVFPMVAVVAGWGSDALRDHSDARSRAEDRLAHSEADKARLEERASIANRLHDSFLQTLLAIRMAADNPAQVTYLARRQERELKRTIEQFRSPHDESFRVALLTARDEVEDLYQTQVEANIRADLPLDDRLRAVVTAAREAMVNSAKHASTDSIDLYAQLDEGVVMVVVRDRGDGFVYSPEGEASGLVNSIVRPVESAGGDVIVKTGPGAGTEVVMTLPTRGRSAE